MSGFNPKWIVGKTVASVGMRKFDMSREFKGAKANNPVITFTDGSAITFTTQETGTGEYGTDISYHKSRSA